MSKEPEAKAHYLDFDNSTMKKQVAKNLGIRREAVKEILLPPVGTNFVLQGLVFQVVYVRDNPLSISAKPIGLVQEEGKKK